MRLDVFSALLACSLFASGAVAGFLFSEYENAQRPKLAEVQAAPAPADPDHRLAYEVWLREFWYGVGREDERNHLAMRLPNAPPSPAQR